MILKSKKKKKFGMKTEKKSSILQPTIGKVINRAITIKKN